MPLNSKGTKKLNIKLIVSAVLLFPYIMLGAVSAETAQTPVKVWVNATSVKGGIRYDYQLINESPSPITSLIIGFNDSSDDSELKTPPTGWSISTGIPAKSVSSPTGWTAIIIPTEESDLLQLQWEISGTASSLPPGQSLKGFSVTVPKNDQTYMTSDWTVFTKTGAKASYTGKLQIRR